MVSSGLTLHFILSKALGLPLLNLRQFRVRVEFFRAKVLGALQGRDGVVGPDALKVGLTVSRTRRCVSLIYRRRRSLPRDGDSGGGRQRLAGGWRLRQQHNHDEGRQSSR